ncbi:MAG: hypothetical protein WDO24_26275 [Pseudomonadota bacterium]
MASRPSSTIGSARGDGREPVVARVVPFTTRERGLTAPANDNVRPVGGHLGRIIGPAVLLALMAGGSIYLYLS